MTKEEKWMALQEFCKRTPCGSCPVVEEGVAWTDCIHCYDDITMHTDDDIDRLYSIASRAPKPETSTPEIKDSGNRREFSTGAVRDIQEGKGRCDLLPLDVVAEYIGDGVLGNIYRYTEHGERGHLKNCLRSFTAEWRYGKPDAPTMLLEVSKHFEAGAKKYGERNWAKGIPTHCYIDSAVRHYLKWLRGDTDEPHDRAFVWNILCCIWTCKHMPELNDYRQG